MKRISNIRVCYITSFFPPTQIGGVERYLLNIISSMGKERINPMIITKFYPPLKRMEKKSNLLIFRIGHYPIPFFTTRYISPFLQIFENSIFYSIIGFYQSLKIINQVDIIHSNLGSKWDLFMGNKLSKKLNKKHILTIHGRFGIKPEDIFISHKLLKNLKKVDFIIVNRNQTYNILKKKGFNNVKLMRNSILVSNFKKSNYDIKQAKKKDQKRCLFIGRLCYRRGAHLALSAFLLAAKECENIELWIVGTGGLEKELKIISNKSQFKKQITFFGKQNDVRPFLWKSDIFLATSPIANSPSLSLREAMASGLGIIATNVEETKSIINQKTGILVESDVQNIKKAIVKLVNDEELLKKISSSASEYAEDNFNIDSYIDDLFRIYNKLKKPL